MTFTVNLMQLVLLRGKHELTFGYMLFYYDEE